MHIYTVRLKGVRPLRRLQRAASTPLGSVPHLRALKPALTCAVAALDWYKQPVGLKSELVAVLVRVGAALGHGGGG